ncbi:MAG: DNA-processing protein DprA [Bacteroidales bacterium]|nr:DNA-processing protein DprA [Bacteroidales bacterium]
MSNNSLLYKIAISLIPGVGSINAKKLIAYTGNVENVFKAKRGELLKIPNIGKQLVDKIINQKVLQRAAEEIKFIEKNNIKPVFYLDKDYPLRLSNCYDSPILLYLKGNIDLNQLKILSIVGTRNATIRGKDICKELITELKNNGHNPIIISGLAYGIDVCAHKAALDNNLNTVAVLGHGLDILYPALHKKIAREIVNKGALITEFTSNSITDKNNFVKRNRIIAGLSDATIVIESGIKGGALITADIANSYNRDVFAVPGRLNDTYSAGCNKLIKINKAALIESAADIEYILGWDVQKKKNNIQRKLFIEFNDEEKIIVGILKNNGKTEIDKICLQSRFTIGKVSGILLNLEFSGILKCLPGKSYELNKEVYIQ